MSLILSPFLFISFFSSAPSWFYQGLLHPLQTPSHLLLILGVSLLISQHSRISIQILAFGAAVVSGLILNQIINLNLNFELILLILTLIVSLVVITKLTLPVIATLFLSFASGIGLGLDSSPILIPGLGSTSIHNWLVGAAFSFIGTTLLTTFIAYFINKAWQGIILRVLGSWIATSAIFVLTFSLINIKP